MEIIISIIILGLLAAVVCLKEIIPPSGFQFNKSVDNLINEKLDKYEITDICPECAKIGDIRIWHHRYDTKVVTLYGCAIDSTFDRGCVSIKTMRRVFRKMGGMKKVRQIQFEYEQKYLEKELKNNKSYD